MEVVLQWLDEADDALHMLLIGWRSVSRIGLALGLVAALSLIPGYGPNLDGQWVVGLSLISLASVLAWTSAAVSLARNSLQRSPVTA